MPGLHDLTSCASSHCNEPALSNFVADDRPGELCHRHAADAMTFRTWLDTDAEDPARSFDRARDGWSVGISPQR